MSPEDKKGRKAEAGNFPLIYLIKGVPFLERGLNFASAAIIIFLMFFVSAEVISRYFIRPIPGHYEIVELVMPIVVFLGLSYTQSLRGHVRVEIFINRLKGRVYHFMESLLLALSLFLFLVFAIYTFKDALWAYQIGDVTPTYYFSTFGTRLCISIGCALICIRLVLQLVQNLIQFTKGIERKDLNQPRVG